MVQDLHNVLLKYPTSQRCVFLFVLPAEGLSFTAQNKKCAESDSISCFSTFIDESASFLSALLKSGFEEARRVRVICDITNLQNENLTMAVTQYVHFINIFVNISCNNEYLKLFNKNIFIL